MAREPDDESPGRQLLLGLTALVAVALVIGGVISVVALGAVRVSGLNSGTPQSSERPSLYIPSGKPTTGLGAVAGPTGLPSRSPSASAGSTGSPSASPSPKPKAKAISLRASPTQAAPGQRVTLSGVYVKGGGATLQVQRFEPGAGWTGFQVTVNVAAGHFTTWVTTSRVGVNRLRVVDPATGKASNPVRVTIG